MSSGFSSLYTSTGPSSPPLSQCSTSAPPLSSNFRSLRISSSTTSCFWLFSCTSLFLPLTRSWNVGGLQARSAELLILISSHYVDLMCIQESNLNPSSSFRIPGYSALRCGIWTHYRSGILFSDDPHASRVVIIFVSQGLSSELSTSSLDLFFHYLEVNM